MLYFVGPYPFNPQPNRKRKEMVEFIKREVVCLLLTVTNGVDDVDTLAVILREKAGRLNKRYSRQPRISVEKYFEIVKGGYIVIYAGLDEDRKIVGTLKIIRVRDVTDKNKFFGDLLRQIRMKK